MRNPFHELYRGTSLSRRSQARHGVLCLLCTTVVLLSAFSSRAAQPDNEMPPFWLDPELPAQIVLNAAQGLGQCHWLDANVLSMPHVSWAYDASEASSGWGVLEPEAGTFHWAPLDAQIAKARSLGKRIWLQLLTTEGSTPQWAKDAGVAIVGSRGGTPVPWLEAYQQLLRRAVHAMAERYDNDPTVEAINVMAGGCYGEMSICAAQADRTAWEQAGYSDERFIAAVKQILDIYLEEKFVWEDGSTSHGFLNTPVVLQLGSGLYGHTTAVIRPVVEYAMAEYGMRVWLKYNGWGGAYDMGWLYKDYAGSTRVGYEPAGNSADLLSKPTEYMLTALDHHASFLCLQGSYFEVSDPKWEEARQTAARYLGAQIVHQGTEAPDSVVGGQEYAFSSIWMNRGTVPLMRPARQGSKDVPASYDIAIWFVDAASGSAVFEHAFTPSTPTTHWYSAQPVRVEEVIRIPTSVPEGQYDLRIGLVDPAVPTQDQRRYFRLINVDLHDGSGRYTVGQITVLRSNTPTAAPEATPTPAAPGTTGNWLSRLLRALWEWLRSLFSRLRYFAVLRHTC